MATQQEIADELADGIRKAFADGNVAATTSTAGRSGTRSYAKVHELLLEWLGDKPGRSEQLFQLLAAALTGRAVAASNMADHIIDFFAADTANHAAPDLLEIEELEGFDECDDDVEPQGRPMPPSYFDRCSARGM